MKYENNQTPIVCVGQGGPALPKYSALCVDGETLSRCEHSDPEGQQEGNPSGAQLPVTMLGQQARLGSLVGR